MSGLGRLCRRSLGSVLRLYKVEMRPSSLRHPTADTGQQSHYELR